MWVDETFSLGLIPARAGNTVSPIVGAEMSWAHPRSRGEHWASSKMLATSSGSSPLARGTQTTAFSAPSNGGLIPARAGNTNTVGFSTKVSGAHPRSRGEHSFSFSTQAPPPGLIPARAGNTTKHREGTGLIRAHPRSRGEHGL